MHLRASCFLFCRDPERRKHDKKVCRETEEALSDAVDYCIENGILEDDLRRKRSQVLGSILEEFDVEKYALSEAEAEQKLLRYWK